jgi:transposase-like protein
MTTCPYCQRSEKQVKAGLNKSGSQRYRCGNCQRRYTPTPTLRGYPVSLHQAAIQHYVDGMNLRRIGRTLGVDHHTVMNWVKTYTDSLADSPPLPAGVPEVCELDELFTFIGDKKTKRTS